MPCSKGGGGGGGGEEEEGNLNFQLTMPMFTTHNTAAYSFQDSNYLIPTLLQKCLTQKFWVSCTPSSRFLFMLPDFQTVNKQLHQNRNPLLER
jgi:hypothetical protein